ncbi:MAG: SDR family NAD(P)-dependent oxidoreductase [Actinomycetota bacterium]|nr:SDR family NAD(P)-dependent oxidoreductase [Actinomycetota bacterium]MDH5223210.1 SDR family NAD(P)-dependent oxidoreductase [Actinomycetota bacterium]MDH5312799.1 SDR family NAD(P)-dependent oxidoreductase [Actinomycetota bacterium]
MDLGLDGRVAIVTGASKGLGLGAARAMAADGARLVLCARDADRLEHAAAQLRTETVTVAADVADPATPAALVGAALERFGTLHLLVANAGGPPQARALDVDDEAMRAAVEANMLASIRLVQASVPHMREAGYGRICLVTSVAVKQPIPTLAYSNAARTGLWAWAKTAAQDLIDDGITLNLVCPGLHATDRVIELGSEGRLGDPDDFGRVVAFLCSRPAAFVSGAALQVDGAATVGLL